jgi:hypothetical protein
MFGDGIKCIYRICWPFMIDVNDRQQAPQAKPLLILEQS